MKITELNTINWHTMTENERSAWISHHLESKSVEFSNGMFIQPDGGDLPPLTLDRLAAIESSMTDAAKLKYVENVMNEMGAKFDRSKTGDSTAKQFYLHMLMTPVHVRALCLYHTYRGEYV